VIHNSKCLQVTGSGCEATQSDNY